MHTDSLYLAQSEEKFEEVIAPEKRDEWNVMRSGDYKDTSTADATENFFPRMCCSTHKENSKREPSLFMGEFRCREMLCFCSKTYCCYDRNSNK